MLTWPRSRSSCSSTNGVKISRRISKRQISRKDWEQGYTQGLDLLGFKYTEMTRPFRGAANVTHPLLAEAVTQFQAQAYKELLPSDDLSVAK